MVEHGRTLRDSDPRAKGIAKHFFWKIHLGEEWGNSPKY